MNRRSSTIIVLGLLLIGIAFCLRQTLAFYNDLDPASANLILAVEASLAAIVLGAGVVLLSRRSRFIRPRRPEAFAHLRRILAAVWS